MLCSFPLFAKPHYNRPIYHSIDQAGQEKKSRNFNPSIGSSSYGLNNRPKPIRTCILTNQEKLDQKHQYSKDTNFYDTSLAKEKPKHDEDGSKKTKSRAMKIYRELKKVKQPISPGGRLSTFFNSLFTNGRKTKISSNDHGERKLSKSIIITPYEHKNLDMVQQNVEHINGINTNYVHEDHQLKFHKNSEVEDKDEDKDDDEDEDKKDDDDDEGASYASSDLFELDIFSSIGIMGLPVYETTNLGINLAINANGN